MDKKNKKYILFGLLTIIPNVGFIVGIILIVKAFNRKDRIFLYLGMLGIFFTAAFFVGVIYFSKYSKTGIQKRTELTKLILDKVGNDVELFKERYKRYPDSLPELLSIDRLAPIADLMTQKGAFGRELQYFNYKKLDSSEYLLFSSGVDQIPNTSDDIYPSLLTNPGLRYPHSAYHKMK